MGREGGGERSDEERGGKGRRDGVKKKSWAGKMVE